MEFGFHPYPASPGDFLSAEVRAAPLASVLTYAAELTSRYQSTRDISSACCDVVPALPAGRWMIYGAGTVGAALSKAMASRADLQIVGYIDRRARELVEFAGAPVVLPSDFAAVVHDFILVAHHTQEAEMRLNIVQAGGREERIVGLFETAGAVENDDLRSFLSSFASRRAVVTTIPKTWTVVPDEALASAMGPEPVPLLYFGRRGALPDDAISDVFPVFHSEQSLPRLRAMLGQLSVQHIYLRTSAHAEGLWLAFVLKLWFPEAKIVSETYDWSVLLRDERLRVGFQYSDKGLEYAHCGEWFSTQHHDLLVSKQGGKKWDDLACTFEAAHQTYFPVVGMSAVQAGNSNAASSGGLRILYAGSLRRGDERGRSEHPDMNYVEMITRVAWPEGVSIDVYNALHRSEQDDDAFATYVAMLSSASPAFRYHRRAELAALIGQMQNFDFGWAVSHDGDTSKTENVTRSVIGNKAAAYVAGNLPIIIDDQFEFMAELVDRFQAGIVVDARNLGTLPVQLAQADLAQMRDGVAKLLAYMQGENAATLQMLRSVMKTVDRSAAS